MNIPENLKSLREEKGYTKEYIAAQLQVSIYTYKAYEWGVRTPNPTRIKKISKILECTTDDLLKEN